MPAKIILQNIPYWIGLGTSGIAGLAEPYWATAHDLLPVAAYHLGLTQPENTWDRNDPMDKLFYVCIPRRMSILGKIHINIHVASGGLC